MHIFREVIEWLAKSGDKDAIYHEHQQLKELRGYPVSQDGSYDPNIVVYEKTGELPSITRLKNFEEKHGLR